MKKILAALAAICLMVAALPTTALAETVPYTAPANLVEETVIDTGVLETDDPSVVEILFEARTPGQFLVGFTPMSDVPAPDDPPGGGGDVPEPKSVALASIALGALVWTRRSGRRQRA